MCVVCRVRFVYCLLFGVSCLSVCGVCLLVLVVCCVIVGCCVLCVVAWSLLFCVCGSLHVIRWLFVGV